MMHHKHKMSNYLQSEKIVSVPKQIQQVKKKRVNRLVNKSVDFRTLVQHDSQGIFPKIRLKKYDEDNHQSLTHHPSNIKLLKNLKIEEIDLSNRSNLSFNTQTISLKPIVDWNLKQIDFIQPRRKYLVI